MNEKSKAFELIEFVWNNEKTDSYLRVNIAMYEAVKLAIISQMKFNKEDFQNIFSKFSGGYWFGVNANGKGYGENFYRKAVTSGKACGFTPLWYVSDRCEVIGNAFDNPELMKEGVQP